MTTLEALEKARNLISDPANWLQGPVAQDAYGNAIACNDDGACRFCALGAIWHVFGPIGDYLPITDAIEAGLSGRTIAAFNDDRRTKHSDVLDAFTRAIARLREQEARDAD